MSDQHTLGCNQRSRDLGFSLIIFISKSRSVGLKTVLLLSVFLHFTAGSASASVKHPQEAKRPQRRSPGVRGTTGPTKSDTSGISHLIIMATVSCCHCLLPDLQIQIDNVVVYFSLLSWEWRQDNYKTGCTFYTRWHEKALMSSGWIWMTYLPVL